MTAASIIQGRLHSNEVTLSYVKSQTEGMPILLLHGTGSRWQPFQAIMPALAEKLQFYALDLRGHGESSHTPGAYRLRDYTRDIHEFIVQEVQKPVVIYGHSLGALISINLAALHPQEVAGLILGDPPLYYWNTFTKDTFWHEAFTELLNFMNEYRDPERMHAWLIENAPSMSAERRVERVDSLRALDPDVVRAVISDELMKDVSLRELAPRVSCPVMLLRGNLSLGSALREEDVEFARANFPNIHILDMETIGHGIIPTALLPQLIEFISTEAYHSSNTFVS